MSNDKIGKSLIMRMAGNIAGPLLAGMSDPLRRQMLDAMTEFDDDADECEALIVRIKEMKELVAQELTRIARLSVGLALHVEAAYAETEPERAEEPTPDQVADPDDNRRGGNQEPKADPVVEAGQAGQRENQ